jgi:hypothetical protein
MNTFSSRVAVSGGQCLVAERQGAIMEDERPEQGQVMAAKSRTDVVTLV